MPSFSMTTLLISLVCAAFGFAVCFFASCPSRRAKDRKTSLLESALDAPAHGLIFFDQGGQYFMMNKETPRFLSFMLDEAQRTKTINEFFAYVFDHAVDSDVGTRNAIERSPLGEKFQGGFREILQLEDGRYILAQAQKAATGTIVTLIDITHRKKREDELIRLSRVNQDLVAAVESSASGFLISNPKLAGNPIIFVNESACRIVGLPRVDILGNEWKFVLDALDGLESSEPAVRAIQRAEVVGVEIRHTSDDTTRWYNLRISPVRDQKGNLDLFIGVLTDTTELRTRESEFFQSQKLEALGQLAGGIAHDFNNVLSIIDGYTRLTAGQIDKAHPSQSNLERVKIAVERGAALTRQLLMFGRRKIVLDTVQDLTRIVREQQIMLIPLVDGKVELDIETAPDPLFVECAADEVGQIVMNLAINARDAMPQG
ncbi:MAG TPA: PAS domain-containing protein, partial [Alphaproteobacteria bacterium]|nr:PAS domain-containing protein [Alphaproteobacteria bacterium]